jgi:hypothetical protein
VCGFPMLLGPWTRAAAAPLFIVIVTAIATTKIPELFRANQGFCDVLFAHLPDLRRWRSVVPGRATRPTLIHEDFSN